MQSTIALRLTGSLVLALCFGLGALAGCGGGDDPSPAAAGSSAGGTTSGGSANVAGGGGAGGVTAGTSSAGSSASAAGSSGAFNPCPSNGDACKIMPMGDSITDGSGSTDNGSYRAPLFHLSLMNDKKLTFVGSGENGPDMVDDTPFPRQEEGHSAWAIDDGMGRMGLYPQVQGWLTATPPHIVTLMIGTNDVDISYDLANAGKRLGLLLDRIAMYAPDALIVVAQMVPTTDDTENQRVMTFNAAIPGLVKERADAGMHITSVDMYGAFTKNAKYKTEYMTDKLHPKDAGYVVMADTWWATVGPLLPPK